MFSGLKEKIWYNKHLRLEIKARIYKTAVKPIMIYIAEIRKNPKRIIETCEIKIIRGIPGKALWNRQHNTDLSIKDFSDREINGKGTQAEWKNAG